MYESQWYQEYLDLINAHYSMSVGVLDLKPINFFSSRFHTVFNNALHALEKTEIKNTSLLNLLPDVEDVEGFRNLLDLAVEQTLKEPESLLRHVSFAQANLSENTNISANPDSILISGGMHSIPAFMRFEVEKIKELPKKEIEKILKSSRREFEAPLMEKPSTLWRLNSFFNVSTAFNTQEKEFVAEHLLEIIDLISIFQVFRYLRPENFQRFLSEINSSEFAEFLRKISLDQGAFERNYTFSLDLEQDGRNTQVIEFLKKKGVSLNFVKVPDNKISSVYQKNVTEVAVDYIVEKFYADRLFFWRKNKIKKRILKVFFRNKLWSFAWFLIERAELESQLYFKKKVGKKYGLSDEEILLFFNDYKKRLDAYELFEGGFHPLQEKSLNSKAKKGLLAAQKSGLVPSFQKSVFSEYWMKPYENLSLPKAQEKFISEVTEALSSEKVWIWNYRKNKSGEFSQWQAIINIRGTGVMIQGYGASVNSAFPVYFNFNDFSQHYLLAKFKQHEALTDIITQLVNVELNGELSKKEIGDYIVYGESLGLSTETVGFLDESLKDFRKNHQGQKYNPIFLVPVFSEYYRLKAILKKFYDLDELF